MGCENRNTRMLLGCVLGFFSAVEVGCADDATARTRDEIRGYLVQAAEGPASRREARRALAALPSDEALPALVAILDERSVSTNVESRTLVYESLVQHQASRTEAGREKLRLGLSDPASSVASLCCSALDEPTRAGELERRAEALGQAALPTKAKQQVLKELARWQECAAPAVEAIGSILRDGGESARVHGLAATAILEIGGLAAGAEEFGELSPAATHAALDALTRFMVKHSNLVPVIDRNSTNAVSDVLSFCAASFSSNEAETRKSALRAYWYLFGLSCYLNRQDETFGLPPAHRASLEMMAQQGVDPSMQRLATDLLTPDLCQQFVEEYQRRVAPSDVVRP